jgi:hypothetical protein
MSATSSIRHEKSCAANPDRANRRTEVVAEGIRPSRVIFPSAWSRSRSGSRASEGEFQDLRRLQKRRPDGLVALQHRAAVQQIEHVEVPWNRVLPAWRILLRTIADIRGSQVDGRPVLGHAGPPATATATDSGQMALFENQSRAQESSLPALLPPKRRSRQRRTY